MMGMKKNFVGKYNFRKMMNIEKYFGELCGISKEQSDAILRAEIELAKAGFPGKRDVILEAMLQPSKPPMFEPIVINPKYLSVNIERG